MVSASQVVPGTKCRPISEWPAPATQPELRGSAWRVSQAFRPVPGTEELTSLLRTPLACPPEGRSHLCSSSCREKMMQDAGLTYQQFKNCTDNLNAWLERLPHNKVRPSDGPSQIAYKLQAQKVRSWGCRGCGPASPLRYSCRRWGLGAQVDTEAALGKAGWASHTAPKPSTRPRDLPPPHRRVPAGYCSRPCRCSRRTEGPA